MLRRCPFNNKVGPLFCAEGEVLQSHYYYYGSDVLIMVLELAFIIINGIHSSTYYNDLESHRAIIHTLHSKASSSQKEKGVGERRTRKRQGERRVEGYDFVVECVRIGREKYKKTIHTFGGPGAAESVLASITASYGPGAPSAKARTCTVARMDEKEEKMSV